MRIVGRRVRNLLHHCVERLIGPPEWKKVPVGLPPRLYHHLSSNRAIRNAAARELIYFLHIPKTSGMSVNQFLRQVWGESLATRCLLWDELVKGGHEITEETRMITGHFAGLFPLWLGFWPRMMTVLRDPVARSLSHINHIQRDVTHTLHQLARGRTVLEYCEEPTLRRTIDNAQSRYLASLGLSLAIVPGPRNALLESPAGMISQYAEQALHALDRETGLREQALNGLSVIDAVGICEEHEASLRLIAKTFGWTLDSGMGQIKVNVAVDGKSLAGLSSVELERLKELNRIDREVYAFARDAFRRRCAELSIALADRSEPASASSESRDCAARGFLSKC